MPIYIFACSTVGPQTVQLDVANPPLELLLPFDEDLLTVRIFMFGSQGFHLEVTSSENITDFGRLAGRLSNAMSGLYDAFGLSSGAPLTVRLDGFQVAGSRFFAKLSPSLPQFSETISQAGLKPHDWIELSLRSQHLTAALRDLRLAMQTPDEAATHCYRAIERIRHAFSQGEKDRGITWARLREALRLERGWLDTYTAHATAVRHGELTELTLDERNKCLTQAATVAIRYAAYLEGGGQNLSPSIFPILA